MQRSRAAVCETAARLSGWKNLRKPQSHLRESTSVATADKLGRSFIRIRRIRRAKGLSKPHLKRKLQLQFVDDVMSGCATGAGVVQLGRKWQAFEPALRARAGRFE